MERERVERGGGRERSCINCFLLQQLGLGRANARSQDPHLGLLHGWWGPRYVGITTTFQSVHIEGILGVGVSWNLNLSIARWDVGILHGVLTAVPNTQHSLNVECILTGW